MHNHYCLRSIGVITVAIFTLTGCYEQRASVVDHYTQMGSDRLLQSEASHVTRELRARQTLLKSETSAQASEGKGDLATAETSVETSKPQVMTLATVLTAVAERNPSMIAARHRWQAATNKSVQALSLPDPMLNARYFAQSVETRVGPQHWSLGISQRIPFPGKLILAGRIADKEAEAAQLRYEAALRNALANAKERYFELYYIDRAQSVTAEIEKLYSRYAALAVGGKAPGAPKLPETFRAESQRAQLAYDLVLLREMRAAQEERLRAIVGANPEVIVGVTAEVIDPNPISATAADLQALAAAHNQELAAAGIEVERAEFQSKLARRAPIPDFTIGADYIKVGSPIPALRKTPDAGKDGVTVGVGMSVPLWFPKYRAMAREADENESAARADQKALVLNVRSDVAEAYFNLNNSYRLVRLYRDTLIPQARQALNSSEELYRKGETSLSSLLETTGTVYNFELARLRATADYYQNVARIERVLGTPLQLVPAETPTVAPNGEVIEKGAGK
jgi:cobalt-zinc-cadmium efflux system outer membrane protein